MTMSRILFAILSRYHLKSATIVTMQTFLWTEASMTSCVPQYRWWMCLPPGAPWPGRWYQSPRFSGLLVWHGSWLHRVGFRRLLSQRRKGLRSATPALHLRLFRLRKPAALLFFLKKLTSSYLLMISFIKYPCPLGKIWKKAMLIWAEPLWAWQFKAVCNWVTHVYGFRSLSTKLIHGRSVSKIVCPGDDLP